MLKNLNFKVYFKVEFAVDWFKVEINLKLNFKV